MNYSELYIIALMTGLVGSLHCIGMCGPIAIALPLGKKSWGHRALGGMVYNTGRIITYGFLGAIFGLLGQGIEMAGLQRWASIFIGAVMILSVIFPALFKGCACRRLVWLVLFRPVCTSSKFMVGVFINGVFVLCRSSIYQG